MQSSVANYRYLPLVRITDIESVILRSPLKPHPSRLVVNIYPRDFNKLIGCS